MSLDFLAFFRGAFFLGGSTSAGLAAETGALGTLGTSDMFGLISFCVICIYKVELLGKNNKEGVRENVGVDKEERDCKARYEPDVRGTFT